MKRELLSVCLGAMALTCLGAVTVGREGQIKSPAHAKETNVAVRGEMLRNLMQPARLADSGVIVNPPDGRKQMMLGSSITFYLYYDEIAQDESYGLAYEAVFCDDGSVYLKNPVSMFDWNTYIKGELTDEGISFSFPQHLYTLENEEGGAPVEIMADVLEYAEIEDPLDPENYFVTFVPSEETRTVTFVKDEDGAYVMEGDYMIGLTWNDIWQGYGEMQLRLEPFDATPVAVPSGLAYDYSYILADELNGWDHTVLRPLGIAWDGDDVYLSGIASGMPGAVIKGSFDRQANTLTIDSDQFMGEFYNHYIFMMTGAGYTYYDEFWEEDMVSFDIIDEPLVFNYDPEENVFTPVVPEGNEYAYLIFNFGNTTAYPCEYYAVDRIYSQGRITDYAPVNPEVLGINNISVIDPDYSYSFEFNIFGDNAEGQILRDECIYYNLFVNGELYTFRAEDYPQLEEEGYDSLTDIPVMLNVGDDIFASGNYHGIAFRTQDIETVGVRAVYIDGDIRGESEIVTVDTEGNPVGAVEGISAGDNTGVREYFDTFGRRVKAPLPGTVIIERSATSDGRVKVRKVIR